MHQLKSSKGTYLLFSLAVLVLDQWSKWLVERHLPLHQPKEIIPGFLNFTHVQNTGVAFGMFAANGSSGGTAILTILGLIALTVVGVYFWQTSNKDVLMLTSLSLILGGAIGNLMDRIAAGSVTDFIDAYLGTYHWHTFNLADSAITVGICLMALEILLSGKRSKADSTPTRDGSLA
jgi:signal peptidase II